MHWWMIILGIAFLAAVINGMFLDESNYESAPVISNPTDGAVEISLPSTETILTNTQGTTINLSNKSMVGVPVSIFARRNVTTLDLSHNLLTGALPAEVRKLSDLEVLDLSHNQFTGVPAEVGQLENLRELDLSYNQLTGLPREIANLKNLEILDLRGNRPSQQDVSIITAALPNTAVLLD